MFCINMSRRRCSRRRCCLFPLSKRQTDATALGTFSKRFFVVVKEEDILMKPTTAFLVPIFLARVGDLQH